MMMKKSDHFKSIEQQRENKILLGKMLMIMKRPRQMPGGTAYASNDRQQSGGGPSYHATKRTQSTKHGTRKMSKSMMKEVERLQDRIIEEEAGNAGGASPLYNTQGDGEDILGYARGNSARRRGSDQRGGAAYASRLKQNRQGKTVVTMFHPKDKTKSMNRSRQEWHASSKHSTSSKGSRASSTGRSSRGRQSLNFEKRVREQSAIMQENSRLAKKLINSRPQVPGIAELRKGASIQEKLKQSLNRSKLGTPSNRSVQSGRSNKSSRSVRSMRSASPKPEFKGFTGMRNTTDILSVAPPALQSNNNPRFAPQYKRLRHRRDISGMARMFEANDYEQRGAGKKKTKQRSRSNSSRGKRPRSKSSKKAYQMENQTTIQSMTHDANFYPTASHGINPNVQRAKTAGVYTINAKHVKNTNQINQSAQIPIGGLTSSDFDADTNMYNLNLQSDNTSSAQGMHDPPVLKNGKYQPQIDTSGMQLDETAFQHNPILSPVSKSNDVGKDSSRNHELAHKTLQIPQTETHGNMTGQKQRKAFSKKGSRSNHGSKYNFDIRRKSAQSYYSCYNNHPSTNKVKGLSQIYKGQKSDHLENFMKQARLPRGATSSGHRPQSMSPPSNDADSASRAISSVNLQQQQKHTRKIIVAQDKSLTSYSMSNVQVPRPQSLNKGEAMPTSTFYSHGKDQQVSRNNAKESSNSRKKYINDVLMQPVLGKTSTVQQVDSQKSTQKRFAMPPRPTRTADGGTRTKLRPIQAKNSESYEMIAEEIQISKKVGTQPPSVQDESEQTFTHPFYQTDKTLRGGDVVNLPQEKWIVQPSSYHQSSVASIGSQNTLYQQHGNGFSGDLYKIAPMGQSTPYIQNNDLELDGAHMERDTQPAVASTTQMIHEEGHQAQMFNQTFKQSDAGNIDQARLNEEPSASTFQVPPRQAADSRLIRDGDEVDELSGEDGTDTDAMEDTVQGSKAQLVETKIQYDAASLPTNYPRLIK